MPDLNIAYFEKEFARQDKAVEQMQLAISKRLDQQSEEIKAFGETSAQTAKRLDKHDEEWTRIQTEFVEMKASYDQLVLDFKAGKEQRKAESKSMGDLLMDQKSWQDWSQKKSRRPEDMILEGKSLLFLKKTLSGVTGNDGAALTTDQRLAQVFQLATRPATLLDLMMVQRLKESSLEYVRENQVHWLYTEVASTANSGQKDVVVDNARGFIAGRSLTLAPNLPASETHVIDTINFSTNTITLLTNLANTHAADVAVVAEEFSAAPETTIKPQMRIVYETLNEAAKTVAAWIPITRQLLQDGASAQVLLEGRLRDALRRSAEIMQLYGDGSSDEFQGLMTVAGTNSYAWSEGVVGDTKLDAIRRAMTIAHLSYHPPTATILNPYDLEDIETLKGTDKKYLFYQIPTADGIPRLWRVPIVETQAMDEGDFLTGAFNQAAALWSRMSTEIRVTDSHGENFTKNINVLLAEERMMQAIYLPRALTVGNFDQAPTP